jgi:hypothetical protein
VDTEGVKNEKSRAVKTVEYAVSKEEIFIEIRNFNYFKKIDKIIHDLRVHIHHLSFITHH